MENGLNQDTKRTVSKVIVCMAILLLLVAYSEAGATNRYVCNNISTCNANGGSGWSGTPGTLTGCGSKTNPCNTLALGYASMSSGDTLIIGNGTYTGTSNRTTASQKPPDGTYSGSTGLFSSVQAEVDWGVTVDGQNSNAMFDMEYGVHKALSWKGIKWLNDSDGMIITGNGSGTNYSWIKFKNCAMQMYGTGSQGNWWLSYIDNLLLEDVVSFGDARYGIVLFQCNNAVVRRAVVRLDKADGSAGGSTGWPVSAIQMYDTQNSEVQNAIVLDSDASFFTAFSEVEGTFDVRVALTRGSANNYWRGNISLNNKLGRTSPTTGWAGAGGIHNGGPSTYYSNTVIWDGQASYVGLIYPQGGASVSLDHMTVGKIAGDACYGSAGKSISSSVWTQITGTAIGGSSITYNDAYGNGSNGSIGSNSRTVNPIWSASNPTGGLKYLPRIESGSNISGYGSGGTDMGASVLYKTGTDGTFYGQTGYNTLTSNSLWPYPNEDAIKTMMAGYSHSGGPAGARGFATGTSKDGSAQTLTKYIWEYLGNQIPDDIYGGGGALSPPSGLRIVAQ
jgi:hypothetical protein